MTTARPWGRIALVVLFAILSANSLAQAVLVFAGRSIAAAGYGLVSAGMLVALPAILSLPREESGGIWIGATAIALFSDWAIWFLRRAVRTPGG